MKDTISSNSDSQAVLNQIILEFLKEQKRKKRGRRLFRVILILLLLFVFYLFFSYKEDSKQTKLLPHIGIIDLDGKIFDEESASADNFIKSLKAAYKHENLKALLIRINSPGGSPVQAETMFQALKSFQKRYPDIKTYAVCSDICASAAYYVAAAADEIYASPSSLVGSIGVLYNGFGFVDSLQKLGVTRRLMVAGKNKGFLDAFSPVQPNDQAFLQQILDELHTNFIEKVKEGRGDRLKIDDLTFSGLFWTGEQAKARGLIDGIANSYQLSYTLMDTPETVDYTHKQSWMDRFSKNVGASAMAEFHKIMGSSALLAFGQKMPIAPQAELP